jgi:hypothetical protein
MRYVLVLGLSALACNADRERRSTERSEPEGLEQAPPDSIPGELGGPCGVNYAACETSEELVERFRRLKKSAFTDTCEVAGPNGPWAFTMEMDVPKLVNDHNQSEDRIRIRAFEHRDDSGEILVREVRYFRNGAEVLYGMRSEASEPYIENADVMKGGFETSLTMLDPEVFVRFNQKSAVCRGSVPFFRNPQCTYCLTLKGVAIFAIAFSAGTAAGVVGAAEVKGLITGTAAVSTFLTGSELTYSCGDQCRRGDCTQLSFTCRDNCPPPPRCTPCGPDGCPPCSSDICREQCDRDVQACCRMIPNSQCSGDGGCRVCS